MQYEGWVNPYGASIGDLIARSHDAQAHAAEMTAAAQARAAEVVGAAQARAAEARGQAWSGAAQSIGNTIANIPVQLEQQKNARIDRALKQEQLQTSVEGKQEVNRQRIVTTIGRLANGSTSPDDFVSGLDDMAGLGGLPKDVAAHIAQQVRAAGPDGWDAVKTKYVEFGSQYAQAVKLGEKDRLVNPQTGKALVDAVPQPMDLGPGHVAVLPGAPGANGAPATAPVQVGSAPFSPAQTTAVVNGAVVPLSGPTAGQPIAPAVPKQEGASEVALNSARVDQVNKDIEKIDNEIAGSMPITAKDRAELAIQRQRLEAERLHYKTIENGQDITSPKNQEHLEQSYSTLLKTTQSSRAGGLGLEDKKVDQARHLLALMDQQKDANGQYHITPTQQAELSIGLATLLSPNGAPSDHTIQLINQATAEGDVAKMITYATGTPVKGTPQDLAQQLRDSIERQGVQAETNREGHFNQLRAFAPTDLAPERRERLEKGLIGANRLSVEMTVPGVGPMRFPTQTAADKFVADARAKGLMK